MKIAFVSLNDRGNLGARQLVALAKRQGHAAYHIIFGEYEHDHYEFSEGGESAESRKLLEGLLDDLKPDIVGVSYRSAMASLARALAPTFQRYCRLLVAGGIGATSDPQDALTWADGACVGEGEHAITDLLNGLPLTKCRNFQLPGASGGRAPLISDLDRVPFPDYCGETTWTIVRGQLVHPDGRTDNDIGAYPILTSRGCVRACTYCHNSTVHKLYAGQRYARQRSVANVMQEIAWARERFEFKLLSIYDDLFIANPEWCFEFARELPKVWSGPRRFWCMTHPAYIRSDVLEALIGAGLEEVCLGVQSGSDRILQMYRRGTSREQIFEACKILAELASKSQTPFRVKIDIISANPLETPDDIQATMRLLQDIPKREDWYPGLSRLTIFPGTEISRMTSQEECDALHNDRQDFIDGLYRAAFVRRWWELDLADVIMRYDDFVRFRESRQWPADKGVLSDEHWIPLTTWLDEGAP